MKKNKKMNFIAKPLLATSFLFSTVLMPLPFESTVHASAINYQTQMDGYTSKYVAFQNKFDEYVALIEAEEDFDAYISLMDQTALFYESYINKNNAYVSSLNSEIQSIDQDIMTIVDAQYQMLLALYHWNLDEISDAELEDLVFQLYNEGVEASDSAINKLVSYQDKHKINYSQSFEDITGHDFKEITAPATTYKVKKGDTLYKIAKTYGLSVQALKDMNNLKSNVLSIGQVLKVKTGESTPTQDITTYKAKKGDTLYSVAKKYGLSVQSLKNMNNLKSDFLSVGQVLKVKTKETVNTPTQPTDSSTYKVKKGDTLYKIAKTHNLSVKELKAMNGLKSDTISVGQSLKVKATEQAENTYTVKKGDTLYRIAKNNKTSVDKLMKLNHLSSSSLTIGQVLVLK